MIDSPMSRKQHRHLAICLLPTAKILVYSFLLKQVFHGPSTCFEGDRNKAAASEDERKQKKNTSVLKKKKTQERYRALCDITNRFGEA